MKPIKTPGYREYLPPLADGYWWNFGVALKPLGYILLEIRQKQALVAGGLTVVTKFVSVNIDPAVTRTYIIDAANKMAGEWKPWNPEFSEAAYAALEGLQAPKDERE